MSGGGAAGVDWRLDWAAAAVTAAAAIENPGAADGGIERAVGEAVDERTEAPGMTVEG
jgi:hypothetical protein